MEQREGLMQFQLKEVTYINNRGRERTKDVLQYRQCFNGIWDVWKDVPVASKNTD